MGDDSRVLDKIDVVQLSNGLILSTVCIWQAYDYVSVYWFMGLKVNAIYFWYD